MAFVQVTICIMIRPLSGVACESMFSSLRDGASTHIDTAMAALMIEIISKKGSSDRD